MDLLKMKARENPRGLSANGSPPHAGASAPIALDGRLTRRYHLAANCDEDQMNLDEPSDRQIYELKIELLDIKPKIWRRVLVPGSLTLAQLHEVVQTAIGWTNSHLHEFIVGAHSYSDPEFEIEEAKNEDRYRLATLAPQVRNTIACVYDFGDGWEHQIRVDNRLTFVNENRE